MSEFSSQVRFQKQILPILQKHGKEIGVRSREGDANCADVIRLYMMLSRFKDPTYLVMLEASLEKSGYRVPSLLEIDP
jgi:hypothetical protein